MFDIVSKYDLFIFDLDDTLIKTEHYHYNSWLYILKERLGNNFYISYKIFISKFHSDKMNSIKSYLFDDLGIPDYENLIKRKNDYYINLIHNEKNNITLIDGVYKLLKNIIKHNKKFVIVSNSLKSNIDFFLELFPILKFSSKNYYREIISVKKPDPACYLKVVEDFPYNKMIGFEDSITGIHSISQVTNIDVIFINNSEYYFYDYIIKNYKLKSIINNYNYLISI